MLYLEPPFHIVRGVSVFSDHADPLQFYYLPAMPHLSTLTDQATGTDVPAIQLLAFDGEVGGGFLNFTVDLGISPELLEEVRGEVGRIFDVDGPPRLAPAPLEDGKVRLFALGKQSPIDPPPPVDPGAEPPPPIPGPEFVLKIDHPARPSLFGDNHAIFSLRLDKEGVALVRGSLEGVLLPIGIIYELEFLGLRPAFNVRVHADWDRVQTHFQEKTEARLIFFSTEVDEMVDELIESKAIVIEVDNFVPEGEEGADTITDPQKAVDQVKDMIFDTFFEPSLNPVSAEKDGWDKAIDVASKVSTLAVTGGWAGVASASYKKVDLTRVDRKRFDFNLRERTTVRRRIYPQAHLEGLTRHLRDGAGNIDLDDFVRLVRLDDPFFRHRTVTVINRADVAGDDIQSIKVRLRYGTEPKSVTLDAATPSAEVEWASILADGAMVPEVVGSYTVTFGGVDTIDRPAALTSGEFTLLDGTLDVSPRADDLYHVVNVPITALGFPWDRYPHVQVDLRYADPANQIDLDDTVILDATRPATTWKWFLRDRAMDRFEYRATFRAADNRDWATDWTPVDDEQILLRDPRASARTVTVVPAVDWSIVGSIFVDLRYHDPVNGVRAEASLVFSQADAGAKVFSVPIEDPDQRLVHYDVKLLLTNHALIELPASTTMQNQVFVRADMRGHRVVTVRPDAVDFAAKKVREVRATLRYADADNGLAYLREVTFTSPLDLAVFEYDFVDPQKRGFTVESLTIFTNGFTAKRPIQAVDADAVAVKVA